MFTSSWSTQAALPWRLVHLFLLNPFFLSTFLPPFFSQLGPFPPGSPSKSSMTRKLNRFVTGSYCSAQRQVARAHGSFKLAHRSGKLCTMCICVCVCVHTCVCMLKEEGGGRGRTTEYQELSLHKEIKREYFPEQLKPISRTMTTAPHSRQQ